MKLFSFLLFLSLGISSQLLAIENYGQRPDTCKDEAKISGFLNPHAACTRIDGHIGFPADIKEKGFVFVIPTPRAKKAASRKKQQRMFKRIEKELSRNYPFQIEILHEDELEGYRMKHPQVYQLRYRSRWRTLPATKSLDLGFGIRQIYGSKSNITTMYSLVLDGLNDEKRYYLQLGDPNMMQLGYRLGEALRKL